MVYEYKFPDVGEGIAEGEIVEWSVKEGDTIKADQSLGKVETDKAVVDIPAPVSGVVQKINIPAGSTVKVGEVMMLIETGEAPEKKEIPKEKPAEPKEQPREEKEPQKGVSVVGTLEVAKGVMETPKEVTQTKVKTPQALPLIRKYAKELGLDLAKIKGTGPNGRITLKDLDSARGVRGRATQTTTSKAKPKVVRKYDLYGYIDRIPLKGLRKTIARNLEKSFSQAVPVTAMDDFDITDLVELREKYKKEGIKKKAKPTFLPFIMKALVQTLKDHPTLNAELKEEDEEIIVKKYYNIGIAVNTEDGLMVPVVKGTDQKDVYQLAKEIKELAEKARDRSINLMDLKGSTFTITNYGSVGTKYGTPILNLGNSAILGLGRMEEKLTWKDGNAHVRKILPVSLTFDHKILDGAEAARFIVDLKKVLENPDLLEL